MNGENFDLYAKCRICGKEYAAVPAKLDGVQRESAIALMELFPICPECAKKEEAKCKAAEETRRKREIACEIEKLWHLSGIPPGYRFLRQNGNEIAAPLVPGVAAWISRYANRNILLSGATGTGKSTSAVFCAGAMIRQRRRVRYCKLHRMLSEWREAKTGTERRADEIFFENIGKLDLLIIDEAVGKAKMTDSGQDMMFELLDRICTGEIPGTRVWLLGNFHPGSIVELFGDCEPVLRRLQENFVCGEAKSGSVEVFDVWRK